MAKTKFKQIAIILMLLVMAVSFCACGQLNSTIITYDNGIIEEQVFIELDIESVVNQQTNIANLKSEIEEDALLEANNFLIKLNNKISFDLMGDITEESKDVLLSYKNGISVKNYGWTSTKKSTSYAIGVRFKNMDVYRYYYNISEEAKVEMQQEEHFFYNKVYWYGNSSYVKHRGLYEGLKFVYESKYPNLINHQDAKLTYTYEANLRRLHSDADYIQKSNGKYYHIWVVDADNVNQPVMFYYNIANGENWIILSLLITLTATVLMSSIVIFVKLIKKEKNRN